MCDIFFTIAGIFKPQKIVPSGYYDTKKCSKYAIHKTWPCFSSFVFLCQELLVI